MILSIRTCCGQCRTRLPSPLLPGRKHKYRLMGRATCWRAYRLQTLTFSFHREFVLAIRASIEKAAQRQKQPPIKAGRYLAPTLCSSWPLTGTEIRELATVNHTKTRVGAVNPQCARQAIAHAKPPAELVDMAELSDAYWT